MVDFGAIVRLLQTASKHFKKPPRITFQQFSLNITTKGKYPGSVYVNPPGYGNGWYCRISPTGELTVNQNVLRPPELESELKKLASNPQEYAAKYGQLTGNCCFCSRKLTDDRSLEVGYGEICAGHYGLPWGKKPEMWLHESSLRDAYYGKTILEQLRATSTRKMMCWGSHDFVNTGDGLKFKVKGRKFKGHVYIIYNEVTDYYDLRFFIIRKGQCFLVDSFDDIDFESLGDVIDQYVET